MIQKNLISLMFLVLATLAIAFAEEEEKYDSKYDDIDVDMILANPKLRNQYLDCYLGTAPCHTADAKFFKEMFPDAFVTKCRKCTDKQQEFLDKVTGWFNDNDPDTWKRIVEKALEDAKKKGIKAK